VLAKSSAFFTSFKPQSQWLSPSINLDLGRAQIHASAMLQMTENPLSLRSLSNTWNPKCWNVECQGFSMYVPQGCEERSVK
jgi:hypothetical protein